MKFRMIPRNQRIARIRYAYLMRVRDNEIFQNCIDYAALCAMSKATA